MVIYYNLINVEGELLLRGAYSDSVFRSNSDFSDLCTSIKDVFNVFKVFTGTVSASTPLSTKIKLVNVTISHETNLLSSTTQ